MNKSDYNFEVTCNNILTINSAYAFIQYKIDGVIKVTDQYKLLGIYSKKTSIDLVVDVVLKSVYNDSKKNTK